MPQSPDLDRVTTGGADPTIGLPRQRSAAAQPPTARRGVPRWQRRYALTARLADVAVVTAVVGVGVLVGLGAGDAADRARIFSGLVAGLLACLGLVAMRAWEPRVLGAGSDEFRRLFRGFGGALVVLGLGGLAMHLQSVRVWVFAFVPLACLLSAIGRQALRALLHRERRAGCCMLRVLAVGTEASAADLVARTQRDPSFGWRVVGACTSTGAGAIAGVPVVGDLDGVAAAARLAGIDVVAVAPAPGWGPGRLQRLAWDLEDTGIALAVDPGLMEIAGPRLHIAPVDGMPLLRLSKPRFTGGVRIVKDVVDSVCAALLLLIMMPVFALAAVAVRCGGGPVFFRQERVGQGGSTFRIITFRTLDDDGRVTRVGALLRRCSIDELPQLINVLTGSMSLVGPRPPLPSEVAAYGDEVRRTLLVKPGITGLWQVSGRSELTSEESMRLDLRYVENWSATMDLSIVWRTVGAVVRGKGRR